MAAVVIGFLHLWGKKSLSEKRVLVLYKTSSPERAEMVIFTPGTSVNLCVSAAKSTPAGVPGSDPRAMLPGVVASSSAD